MNDDITARELELTAAIRNALHHGWAYLKSFDCQESGRLRGFVNAIEIVDGVLEDRGFDLVMHDDLRSEE